MIIIFQLYIYHMEYMDVSSIIISGKFFQFAIENDHRNTVVLPLNMVIFQFATPSTLTTSCTSMV